VIFLAGYIRQNEMEPAPLIIVIDDDEDDRFMLREAFMAIDSNIVVIETYHGRHALDLLSTMHLRPALILADRMATRCIHLHPSKA
jgi:CheY-like chemotaxis protein